MAAYNAAKAAVINVTRSLAREWAAERINVNAVCPGSVATPMLRGDATASPPRPAREATLSSPAWFRRSSTRHIQPIEVGRVVVFVLTEAAEIIRGQAINIDGGETPY